jgi:hypothetical protein
MSFKSEEHDNYMIANNAWSTIIFVTIRNIIKTLGAKTVSENITYNYNTPRSIECLVS